MQRDGYGSLVKKKHLLRIPARILHLSGHCHLEYLTDETFHGFGARRLVLLTHSVASGTLPLDVPTKELPPGFTFASLPSSEWIYHTRKQSLKKSNGLFDYGKRMTSGESVADGLDYIIDSFETFRSIHKPSNVYSLIPLLCSSLDGFRAALAVCSTTNSPFQIKNRCDPQFASLKFLNGMSKREEICNFFSPFSSPADLRVPVHHRKFPLTGISFDAILATPYVPEKKNNCATDMAMATSRSASKGAAVSVDFSFGGYPLSSLALISTVDSLSEKVLLEQELKAKFITTSMYWGLAVGGLAFNSFKSIISQRPNDVYHIIAVKKASQSDNMESQEKMIRIASEKKLILYFWDERKKVYKYVS